MIFQSRQLALTFFLLFLSTYATVRGDEFDDFISAKVAQLNIRGASIAYYDKNKMSSPVIRGYGKVSSDESSAAVTPDTTFMLASISKPFAASAVAVLVDKGVISSIDDDICDVIPSEYSTQMCRNPKYPNNKVTWRMLMTHRSSMKPNIPGAKNQSGQSILPSYGPSGAYTPNAPAAGNPSCPIDDTVDFYRALLSDDSSAKTEVGAGVILQGGKPLDWYNLAKSKGGMWTGSKPAQRRNYSNAAFGYIAALVELASGQPFPAFCRDNLFKPLGMDRTAWFRKDLPGDTQEAIPVEAKQNGGFKDIGHYCFVDYASGELRTSANDLSLWGTAMLNYGEPSLWSMDIGREVVKCQERSRKNRPINKKNCQFGYGWILLNNVMKQRTAEAWLKGSFQSYDWTDGIWHDGSEAGSQTNIIILPVQGLFVAVLTNTDLNSEMAAQDLTKAVIEAPLPVTLPVSSPTVAPQPIPTSAPTQLPTDSPNPQPQQIPSSTPTPMPTPHPTPMSSLPPPKCPGQAEFVFKVTTDEFPEETKWVLKRDKQVVQKRTYNTYAEAFTSYEESFCIPLTGKFNFRIEDRYGDGLCCNKGNGSYEISVDRDVKRKGGNFKWKQVTRWTS